MRCCQPYLLAIAWAILGIAENHDYRRRMLGDDNIADGVTTALEVGPSTSAYVCEQNLV